MFLTARLFQSVVSSSAAGGSDLLSFALQGRCRLRGRFLIIRTVEFLPILRKKKLDFWFV